MAKEKIEEVMSLPYYANVESITKLLAAVTKKSGDETSIKNLFGEGKYGECKRALLFFGILNKDMTFSDFGKKLNYALDESEKSKLWCDVVRNIQPYDNFLNYFALNQKGQTECDIELVKKFWAQNNICKSDMMRKDSAVTFAHILSLAGIGEFKKGKQGNTRIVFVLDNLNAYINNAANVGTVSNDALQSNAEQQVDSPAVNMPITKQINYKNANGNVQVNINIDISVDSLAKLKEIMDYLKNDQSSKS